MPFYVVSYFMQSNLDFGNAPEFVRNSKNPSKTDHRCSIRSPLHRFCDACNTLHCIGSVNLVRTFAVIKFYVCTDTFFDFPLGTVSIAIKLFSFECFEKCLHRGVVIRRAFTRE